MNKSFTAKCISFLFFSFFEISSCISWCYGSQVCSQVGLCTDFPQFGVRVNETVIFIYCDSSLKTMQLRETIEQLVATAPDGELQQVKESILRLVPSANSLLINSVVAQHLEKAGYANPEVVISEITKDPVSGKFVDYQSGFKYNLDFSSLEPVDREKYISEVDRPSYYELLVELLAAYSHRHYPSSCKFDVLPTADAVHVLIISEIIEPDNFLSGSWKCRYTFRNQKVEAKLNADIHYYEDGNVRLHFEDKVSQSIRDESPEEMIDFIKSTEDQITLHIVKQFDDLNQNHFKHLRRLLPVTKSKVNWGKAIGNYKLGSNVANR